jgi:hypothetical protein
MKVLPTKDILLSHIDVECGSDCLTKILSKLQSYFCNHMSLMQVVILVLEDRQTPKSAGDVKSAENL